MKYTAEICVENGGKLEKVFKAEEKNFQNNRANYSVKKEKERHTFHVEAEDSTALRAALSSITKVLSVHEKTLHVIGKDDHQTRTQK